MNARTLSPLESKLVMELEWEERRLLTLQDVMDILHCSYPHARKIAHNLERKRWLSRIEPGKYQFIPASRGQEAVPDMNPLLAGSVLVEPYYYAYSTANHHYGFTAQVPATVYLATTRSKRPTEIRGITYRFVSLKPAKFFGYHRVRVYTAEVYMAEPEKAVVDSLDKMHYAGGIVEVAGVVHAARNKVDWEKVVEYALRMETQALVQRLGYLLGKMRMFPNGHLRDRLLSGVGKSKVYLGPPGTWGIGGDYDPDWHVVVNVSRQHLLSEVA